MADWKDSIVLLTSCVPGTTGFGTGFVFHRDSTGRCFLLTCLHVVEVLEQSGNRAPDEPAMILANGEPAEVWQRGDKILDIAVLAVDGLTAHSLPLGAPASGGERIETAGYTTSEEEHDSVTRRPLSGIVKGNNPVRSARRPGKISASYLDLEFEADRFRKLDAGYSGSPVRDRATGAIVGIMNIKRSSTHGHAVCVASCERFEPNLTESLPDYRRAERKPPIALQPPSTLAAEGVLDWLPSMIDHRPQIERVAQCLDCGSNGAAPGFWFYAFDACLSDCPRALAEHLAQRFGGLPRVGPWQGELVTEPPATRFDVNGLWKNLVDQLTGPGAADLSPTAEEDMILDWINAKPPTGSGGVRVLYTELPIEALGPRIPAFIHGAVSRFAALKGIRPGVRMLFLFGCIYREHDWLRTLRLRRRPRILKIAACESLGPLAKLSQKDLEDWLHWLRSAAVGPARVDAATIERLRDSLDPLFPNDAARVRHREVCQRALHVLTRASLSDSSTGGPG